MPALPDTQRSIPCLALLRIHCLGVFRVIPPGETESVGMASKHKRWSLFKYLINHKGRPISTQRIMNLFWPDNENPDDTATLRTAISRLKSALEPKNATYRKSSYIIYSKDTCAFNTNSPFWLDTDEFERLCAAAHKLGAGHSTGETMRNLAIDFYFQALDLYRGEFLSEDLDHEWTVVPREHYRRLFLESSRELADWLLEIRDYARAIGVLQKALKLEPYAEEIQLLLMKVLIETGDLEAAARHYSECSRRLYQELGVKPSPGWKLLYQQVKEAQSKAAYRLILEGAISLVDPAPGPLVCDPDFFWNSLLYERRRIARNGGESGLVILELAAAKENPLPLREEGLKRLERVVRQRLRKCDLVCLLDDQHLALLLYGAGLDSSRAVVAQIKEDFIENPANFGFILHTKLKRVKAT
ncbi:MAG: winged helix-turn-helix domain-containing protein [Firmicutes bacterium]|nr:winged helix-turn-helix domain-containing protein [Bacillota bacterium]